MAFNNCDLVNKYKCNKCNKIQSNFRIGHVITHRSTNGLCSCIAAVGMLHPHHSATHICTAMQYAGNQWGAPHLPLKLPMG